MASVADPQRIPMKMMLSAAADTVAPSPRSWGGEREQTEYVALLVTSHWNVL
jgi:hypothetical protein